MECKNEKLPTFILEKICYYIGIVSLGGFYYGRNKSHYH